MNPLAVITLLIIALISTWIYSKGNLSSYEQWKQQYGLWYGSEENSFRESIFLNNIEKFKKHNSNPNRTYDMGINMFAAMTVEQWVALKIGGAVKTSETINIQKKNAGPVIDWQALGVVTKITPQGQCNAQYAFSAVGAVESLSAIFFKAPFTLSEQQVIDCSKSFGNDGCIRGDVDSAYDFIVTRGLMSAAEYPYVGTLQSCRAQSGTFKKVIEYRKVTNCHDLATSLAKQPISVSIDGSKILHYVAGIFNDCTNIPNYAMLLTGMTDEYWRLRSSISIDWGERGYIRIAPDNTCGICYAGRYPVPAV